MRLIKRLNTLVERWLTAPRRNAAGSLGLFRVLFALFYLLQQPVPAFFADLARIPQPEWKPIRALAWLDHSPPADFYVVLDMLLIFSLVLLLIGFRVRLATLLVLVCGVGLEMFQFSFGKVSHHTFFMSFHIPLFMLFSHWGSAYSLDAVLRRRRGLPVPAPSDDSWRYVWQMRALLLVLSFLFFTAAYNKLRGAWRYEWDLLATLLPEYALRQQMNAPYPVETVTRWHYPLVAALAPLLHFIILAFEGSFPLALLHRHLRNLYLAGAVLMHMGNVFFMNLYFTQMLPAYVIFVDWQSLYERLIPARVRRLSLDRFSTPVLVGGTLGIAALVTLVWTRTRLYRLFLDVYEGGVLMIVIALVALSVLVRTLIHALRDLRHAPAALASSSSGESARRA